MRLLALLLALNAIPALAAEVPPPPPPPPPPPGDAPTTADEPPPPPSSEAVETKGPRTNWARVGAIIGFVAAGIVLGLNVTNELIGAGLHRFPDSQTYDDHWDSAVELVPIAVTAVAGPVTYAGGASARWTKSISGSRALRITGWIAYGVGLLIQLVDIWYVPWWRIIGGLIGAGALVCHGVDALISASEAADVASMASADEGVRIRPVFSLLPAFGGRGGGASFGLVGAF